jgi:hypothetical protein
MESLPRLSKQQHITIDHSPEPTQHRGRYSRPTVNFEVKGNNFTKSKYASVDLSTLTSKYKPGNAGCGDRTNFMDHRYTTKMSDVVKNLAAWPAHYNISEMNYHPQLGPSNTCRTYTCGWK